MGLSWWQPPVPQVNRVSDVIQYYGTMGIRIFYTFIKRPSQTIMSTNQNWIVRDWNVRFIKWSLPHHERHKSTPLFVQPLVQSDIKKIIEAPLTDGAWYHSMTGFSKSVENILQYVRTSQSLRLCLYNTWWLHGMGMFPAQQAPTVTCCRLTMVCDPELGCFLYC